MGDPTTRVSAPVVAGTRDTVADLAFGHLYDTEDGCCRCGWTPNPLEEHADERDQWAAHFAAVAFASGVVVEAEQALRAVGDAIRSRDGRVDAGWLRTAGVRALTDRTRADTVPDLYICPTTGETESRTLGGFDVCCEHPRCPGNLYPAPAPEPGAPLTAEERLTIARAVYAHTGHRPPSGTHDLSGVRNEVERAVEHIVAARTRGSGTTAPAQLRGNR